MFRNSSALVSLLLPLTIAACGGDAATGSLSVLLEAEDTIIDGIPAGDEVENIRDGWEVSFDKYLITIGGVELVEPGQEEGAHGDEHGDASFFVVDLSAIPATGLPLWEVDELEVGDWDFFYRQAGAADGATRHDTVEQGDFDEMVAADLTYRVEGSIAKSGGQACPPANLAEVGGATPNGNTNDNGDDCYDHESVSFSFDIQAETEYGPCEVDEMPGISITENATSTVAATIHGDHIFFNGFPEGDEGGIQRLAQWLADCDLNLDGEVDEEELALISPSDLAELDERYQLGGSPLELTDMKVYVAAQLKTQGHFQGEGECPADGVGHQH